MFTRDFRKLRVLLAAVGVVGALCLGINLLLLGFVSRVEALYDVYPWRHEDYLRCLLPSLYENKGANRILLAGPSDAREGFLYELFDASFPGIQAFQGGQSQGTFDDLLLTLEYTERVFGTEAVPRIIVLGINPRFVANIPRQRSPLIAAINNYSPFYRVDETLARPCLVPKEMWEGVFSRVRFLRKQQPRYRAALGIVLERFLVKVAWESRLSELARLYTVPYRYHHLPPWPPSVVERVSRLPNSFWHDAHHWNPAADSAMIRGQFARLLAFTTQRGIRLFVVNLPENELNRQAYQPGYYESYLLLVQESLGRTPFLDLRVMLDSKEFYDISHPTRPGALRVTGRVLEFIKSAEATAAQGHRAG